MYSWFCGTIYLAASFCQTKTSFEVEYCVAYIGDIIETKKVLATLITVQSFQKLVDIAEDPSNKILCHNNIVVILTSFKHYNS